QNTVLAWIRQGKNADDRLIIVANFSPDVKKNYRIGVPEMGFYQEIFNSDNLKYGGSDQLNTSEIETAPIPLHGFTHSIPLKLPPLGVSILKLSRRLEGLW